VLVDPLGVREVHFMPATGSMPSSESTDDASRWRKLQITHKVTGIGMSSDVRAEASPGLLLLCY